MSAIAVFHADHAAHLQETLKAHDSGLPVFLGNPHWATRELGEAARQIPRGTLVQGLPLEARGLGPSDWPYAWGHRLMIPTGGSGGQVKFIIHTRDSLRAAALGLRDALVARGLSPRLHGISCTPPWHVSGLMPAIRARETGGAYQVVAGRFAKDAPLPEVTLPVEGTQLASLVPAQLHRLLQHPAGEHWLRQFNVILLGGSSVPTEMREQIRTHRLPVFITYGMTETAAACALCPPENIWSGLPFRGQPLPGVKLAELNGLIQVETAALGLGLWPDHLITHPHVTGDHGDIAADGSLRITGRADRVIVSGGEKVNPARVEQCLLASKLAAEAHVFGLADAQWGETVVACVVGTPEVEGALRQATNALEPAARPKRYAFVPQLPRDDRGKIDRAALTKLFA